METNLKFNSAICTSRSQSERLLALGLKKETADMVLLKELAYDEKHRCLCDADTYMIRPIDYLNGEEHRGNIPAWSLHRLIEMLNYQVIYNGAKHEPVIAIDGMAYQDVYDNNPVVGWSGDFYTDVIDCIEWLIKEDYFNKEYLEE